MYNFAYGLFIGLSIGITIGPIAILCIKRTMSEGVVLGLATGLGASLAHLFFGGVAIFGFHFVQDFFSSYGSWVRLIGSSILIAIAVNIARNPISMKDGYVPSNFFGASLSSLLINLSNPITIASYAAFLSIFNLSVESVAQGLTLLVGILSGNLLWWIGLSFSARYARTFFDEKHLKYVNIIAAILLSGLAAVGIVTSIVALLR